MKRGEIKPPKTLWQAIELALHDEALVHRDGRYIVDMDFLHDPYIGKCKVCFAGSVMAKTLGADHREVVGWGEFGGGWRRVFYALDYVRMGNVIDALDLFYPDDPGYDAEQAVTEYAKDRAQWRRDMHKIKRELKARGL